MGDEASVDSHRLPSTISTQDSDLTIPVHLKFLISNIKNLVPTILTSENYSIWRLQLHQHFAANGFEGHLSGLVVCPPETAALEHKRWRLIDRNLVSALLSTISSGILPYVISLHTAHDVWTTLERRLQPTNRSRVIQLKNELHQIRMADRTMQQYLDQIKKLVDNIAAAGSKVDTEDIVLYILNGLPASYNSFKTAIRTSLQPISLDDLYSLLSSEEINLQHQLLQDSQQPNSMALYSNRSNYRGRSNKFRGKNYNSRSQQVDRQQPSPENQTTARSQQNRPVCQICGKTGHTAGNCWHRQNLNYAPPTNSRALSAQQHLADTNDWILDSGASSHLTSDNANLQQSVPYNGYDSISIANGSNMSIQNSGQGLLPLPESQRKLYLKQIYHVPSLNHNLLSVSSLASDNNVSVCFTPNEFIIKSLQDNRVLLRGPKLHGLYHIKTPIRCNNAVLTKSASTNSLWHARLGHPHSKKLHLLSKIDPDINNVSLNSVCVSCNVSKSHKHFFSLRSSLCNKPFQLVHSDVWGPAPTGSFNGFRYYVIFTDDFTRFTWLYLIHTKDEVLTKFQHLFNLVLNNFNIKIHAIQSDGGGEYNSTAFRKFLDHHGITHRMSCPHTPEQNGVAERKNRHLLDLTRTLMHAANLSLPFWAEAVSTANYLVNRLPSSTIQNQTPYYRLYGRHASYSHLRTFGCLCFPWTKPYAPHKLAPRSQVCIFLGYSSNHKGYRCLQIATNRIYISRHVVFCEHIFPFSSSDVPKTTDSVPSYMPPSLLVPPSTITGSKADQPKDIQPHPMQTRLRSGITKPKQIFNLSAITTDNSTPTTYSEASKHSHWREAMSTEFLALQNQGTWSLVPLPSDKPVIGSKWTFKIKLLPNGQVDRYKARLVAQGCSQVFGLNFTETFSPVAKMATIRMLITVALNKQWQITQLDITNAFLHGELHDEVYMKQPRGFEDSNHPNHVCKLHKSIYGLRQSPRQWFHKLTSFLQTLGFGFSRADPSLLIFHKNNIHLFVLIYVDDILITGNNPAQIQHTLTQLQAAFKLKQLGDISLFLGIQVIKTNTGYFLSQSHYAQELLCSAGFVDCKPASTPAPSRPSKSVDDQPYADPKLFRKLAGSLQYLSITRPDIAFTANSICQHMHQPRNSDFQSLKRLLRYIKGSLSFGLPIQTGQMTLRSYSDADWGADTMDRKSISGFCTFLGPNLISWSVKKQTTVARSSTEAEYRSLSSATSDVLWIRRLAADLGIPQKHPTVIHCDNTSTIALSNNPVFHARTKHIELDYHFISDHIRNNNISITHICTTDQIADILTKALPVGRFQFLRSKLTIRSPNG
ncbi:Retrovirus-related Pol polyprotein from transposon TNT 1-94 [Dendrobium catenatum]|uniref:Retrovirus-related Pol polyprotein from transposon TNT 1-94 n=1 Tax=Dendrobium catenatum TaxID=906689 RepID=A0A2I0WTJ7_9ASPA|nr:Retrovirus-related Pol polyprotein from transposon TNT 1-94 [Dendrobium catenatum]